MFRDMSGLAQTAALAQAALQATAAGATAAGQQAGQNLKTVMDANTERMRIAAQLMSGAMTSQAGGGGAPPPGKGTVTERGGELNEARTIDQERAAGGAQGVRTTDIPPAVFASDSSGAATEAPRTTYEDIFRQQAAGPAGQILGDGVKSLLAFDGGNSFGGGGGSGGGSVVAAARKIKVIWRFFALGAGLSGIEFSWAPMQVYFSQGLSGHLWTSKYTASSHVFVSPSRTIDTTKKLSIGALVKFDTDVYGTSGSFDVPSGDFLSVDVYVKAAEVERTVRAVDLETAIANVRTWILSSGGGKRPEQLVYYDGEGEDVGGGSYRVKFKYFPGQMSLEPTP